jgi:hypothetical protein
MCAGAHGKTIPCNQAAWRMLPHTTHTHTQPRPHPSRKGKGRAGGRTCPTRSRARPNSREPMPHKDPSPMTSRTTAGPDAFSTVPMSSTVATPSSHGNTNILVQVRRCGTSRRQNRRVGGESNHASQPTPPLDPPEEAVHQPRALPRPRLGEPTEGGAGNTSKQAHRDAGIQERREASRQGHTVTLGLGTQIRCLTKSQTCTRRTGPRQLTQALNPQRPART